MKILNIIDIPWHSALAAYAFDQSAALAGRGHDIFFAAPENSAAAAFARANGFPLTLIPSRNNYLLLGALLRLKRLVEIESIDVVNAHTGKAQSMARLLSLISSRPFALVRTKADARRPRNGFALGKAALVIAGSGNIKKMYTAAGVTPGRIEVIYQGIIPPPGQPRAANHEPRAAGPGGPLKVGILGRLDPVKGHACFVKAAALVLKKAPDTEFLIAGREENVKYAALETLAKKLGIADKVKYLGHVPDKFAFIRSCDMGVIASLSSEAVSRAALEWLAAGKPLVASSVGGLPEFAAEEWLVPPEDPAMLAEKLLALLGSPEKRLAAGADGRAKVFRDFSPAAFAERTEAVFKKAVTGDR